MGRQEARLSFLRGSSPPKTYFFKAIWNLIKYSAINMYFMSIMILTGISLKLLDSDNVHV